MTTRRRRALGIIRSALERRERREADVRPRQVVGAFGSGRHVVTDRDGGLPRVVAGPGFTYRPGAIVPAARYTGIDDRELLLGTSQMRGGSEFAPIRSTGITNPPPAGPPPGSVVETQFSDAWAIYLDDDGFPFSGRFRVARLDFDGSFLSWVGPTIDPVNFGSTPPARQSWFLPSDEFYALNGIGSAGLVLIDATDGTETTYTSPGDWNPSGRGFGYGSDYWFVERDTVANPARVRCLKDAGGAMAPTLVGQVTNLPRASSSVNVRVTRLGSDLRPYAVVQLSSPTEYLLVDFTNGTTQTVPNEAPENQTRGRDAPGQVGSGETYFCWDTLGKLAATDPNEGADHWPTGWGGRDNASVSAARDVLSVFDYSTNLGSWHFRATTAEEPADGWPAEPEVSFMKGLGGSLYLHPTDDEPSGESPVWVQLRES